MLKAANNMLDPNTKQEIQKMIDATLRHSFSRRRIGDTPTDAFQLTPRKYVNLNGTLANRPASVLAITGQQYYATDINVPLFFDGSKWRNGVGSILASN